ncbi:tetratricopeptide repeat protein [Sphingomonas ginsenosidivorax]|uniref:Tetratricopeptide repeat protein n=1 Tax=Sphingomonas ginsenosidivorax TaxID=862135 RepID=A0A5C6UD72_9SPHN|nr:tetratricopeptide repeat protein [Sphingomonas ginsenosidivorax]TXC70693.1 tetratricopeptide repeat protein [Sphingomonas ginsenosidivorax]
MRGFSLIVLTLAGAATPALAAERTGYTQIAAGNMPAAEQRIVAERRIFPDRPELMLNLAAVYRQTGRDAQAKALYAAVLDKPAVALDTPSGAVVSSHALAERALARFAPQIATR